MRSASSGTMASEITCQPFFCAASFSAGPPRSSYSPALARSEIVIMPTCICTLLHRRFTRSFALVRAVMDRRRHRAFGLHNQTYIRESHVLIHCLAHVINREHCDRDADECLHLNASLRNSSRNAGYLGAAYGRDDVNLNFA